MLQTPQRYPRAGSQSYPGPAAAPNADGSTTVYFAPTKPAGVNEGNWIQTDPTKGWNALFPHSGFVLKPDFDRFPRSRSRQRLGYQAGECEADAAAYRRYARAP